MTMTTSESSIFDPPTRTKSRTIKGGEWRISFSLDVQGHQVDAGELVYSDSFLAQDPAEVGRLVALHLAQRAEGHVKKGKRK